MAEYGNTVLWGMDSDEIGPIDLNRLPVAQDLRSAIERWGAVYDNTLNQDDPSNSGFASDVEQEEFEAEGLRLWRRLQTQLGPEYEVHYFSELTQRLLD